MAARPEEESKTRTADLGIENPGASGASGARGAKGAKGSGLNDVTLLDIPMGTPAGSAYPPENMPPPCPTADRSALPGGDKEIDWSGGKAAYHEALGCPFAHPGPEMFDPKMVAAFCHRVPRGTVAPDGYAVIYAFCRASERWISGGFGHEDRTVLVSPRGTPSAECAMTIIVPNPFDPKFFPATRRHWMEARGRKVPHAHVEAFLISEAQWSASAFDSEMSSVADDSLPSLERILHG